MKSKKELYRKLRNLRVVGIRVNKQHILQLSKIGKRYAVIHNNTAEVYERTPQGLRLIKVINRRRKEHDRIS